jgi:DNA-binding MarR family transcriptional regulator
VTVATERHRTSALAALRTLVAALTRSARSIEWRTGFTNAQLFLLSQIAAAAPLSINELAERARTTQGTVSSVVGRIVRAGLASRARASDDARRVELTITPKGRRLLTRAPVPPTEALIDALDSLNDADARALATGLGALLRVMDLASDEAPMLFEDRSRARHG